MSNHPSFSPWPFQIEDGTGMFFGVKGHWSPINLSALHQSWTIHHPDGTSSRRIEKTSRVVWKLFFGDIPPGLEIVSLDGSNRPETLRALTHSELLRLKRGSLDPDTLPVPPYSPSVNREWESDPPPAVCPFRLTVEDVLVGWNGKRWGTVKPGDPYTYWQGRAYRNPREDAAKHPRLPRLFVHVEDGPDVLP